MKNWMLAQHGRKVETYQSKRPVGSTSMWAPGPRTVDAKSFATYVLLDGSRRDYKGMRIVKVEEDRITVEDTHHIITYVAVGD